jgi:dTDP-4-amino-4,6-dideoxygalactose transaminase
VGSLGHAAAFSFYPTKNLGAYGEGGALTTNDDAAAKFARAARSHGQTARYEHEFPGYNYRMHGFQGAVLRIKLRRLHGWTERRRAIAREYRRMLEGARLTIPVDDPHDECVYHQFAIYVSNRNAVIAQLAERGIETSVHYPKPVHLQPAYSSLGYPVRAGSCWKEVDASRRATAGGFREPLDPVKLSPAKTAQPTCRQPLNSDCFYINWRIRSGESMFQSLAKT